MRLLIALPFCRCFFVSTAAGLMQRVEVVATFRIDRNFDTGDNWEGIAGHIDLFWFSHNLNGSGGREGETAQKIPRSYFWTNLSLVFAALPTT